MKKIIVLLFTVTLVLSLCSCGNSKDEIIICSNCNNEISDDSNFCSSCGTAIERESEDDIIESTDDVESLDFTNIKSQLATVKAIFEAAKDAVIWDMFPNSNLAENGNMIIEGMFSEINGYYEIYCWNNQVYQVVFRWDENEDISSTDVVSDVNGYIGEYKNYNEYWDIYEWETDDIEITYNTEDGVWIEKIFDKGLSEPVITESSIAKDYYMSMTQEDVENEIAVIKNMMSYRNKPKEQVFADYPALVDDDWNQLLVQGSLFGIDGQYVFMYDKETGIIYSIAFDWLPDNMEDHEKHIVHCIELYFGECPDVHNTDFNDEIYYYHDWDATTAENWSVHLSMTSESGWLQFSQLKAEEPETEEHTCIECGKAATNTYTNPFSQQIEYYCYSHYQEILDIIGGMEEDVGNSDYSKHTCMECNREGTHRYESFTGQTEYYCTTHYEELMDMLEDLGVD